MDTPCYHCGTVHIAGATWQVALGDSLRSFCCAGCLAIAQTIHAAGLQGFYATRTATPLPPHMGGQDEWARWDHAATADGIVREAGDGRREASLLLEGVTCGSCVGLIESWLARQPGVLEVRVNYANRRAHVVWTGSATTFSAILGAFAAVGYQAFPYDPVRREAFARSERRTLLLRAGVALLAMMQVMMFSLPAYTGESIDPEQQRLLDWAALVMTLPVVVYSAFPFFRSAWRDVTRRRLGMDVPIAIGLAAAFLASAAATLTTGGPVFYDSVTMFVALVLIARYVELVARHQAGAAIEALARQRPTTAEILPGWPADGASRVVAAAALVAGDAVLVRAGDVIPADGWVLHGDSYVDEALLTGESMPRACVSGAAVLAGAVNGGHPLVVRVRAAGESTRLASILRLTERAAGERPRVARLADLVAQRFVAVLLLVAVATALTWLLFEPDRALAVTFALLVVSCPCALSLATPAALAAAAGNLARREVVFARSDALETLAKVTHVVFDKTGTLTEGRLQLTAVELLGRTTRDDALALAAALEDQSEHPLGRALLQAAPDASRPRGSGFAPTATPQPLTLKALRHVPGEGIEARVGPRTVRIGRPAFVAAVAGAVPAALQAFAERADNAGALVALGGTGGWEAAFAFSDTLRPGATRLLGELRALGLTTILLSGDRAVSVNTVARALGIDDARADVLPEAKCAAIATLQRAGAIVAMVGDGVNDAAALARANVAISLGSATPLAQLTAGVVVMSNRVERIGEAIRQAKRTLQVIRENLFWAAAYNALAIPAAALGYVTPLVAAAGMSASSLIVVGNALRLARSRQRNDRTARVPVVELGA